MALTKVRYKGLSDVRVMSVKDLASVGIHVDKPMQWDASNRHTLHVESLSDEMADLFRREGTFVVSEVDAQTGKTVQDIITNDQSKADDTGNTVIDGTTGQRSTKK